MRRHSNTGTTRPIVYSTSTVADRQRTTRVKGMHRMAVASHLETELRGTK